MLKGSGSDPGDDQKGLFIQHTLLVTISRAVIATLFDDERDAIDIMSDGFASWPHNPSLPGKAASTEGKKWTTELFELVSDYDWRKRGYDVLRELYTQLVPKKHRKDYGEYYTPDWLAEGVVEEICDEAWIKHSVEIILASPEAKDVGVLDPACGSGTFLFHAARKILNSKTILDQGLSDVRKAEVVTSLVMGIDIHPVAIEMARATLLRALPAPPPGGESDLQIFQGDSLLWNRTINVSGSETYEQLATEIGISSTGKESFVVTTPKLHKLHFPLELVTQKSFHENIDRLVKAASKNKPMPTTRNLECDKDYLRKLYETLQKIIEEEGNSVWAWYIFNATGPLSLYKRGVDRIVANPPWVTMRGIQDKNRKEEFEDLGNELGLWGNRKANTGLDIASMFVIRCSNLYLQPNTPQKSRNARSGWVLPWSSLRGGNWGAARSKISSSTEEIWDLREVDKQPFKGSLCAVWYRKEGYRSKNSIPNTILLASKKGKKVDLKSTWAKASWKEPNGALEARDMPLLNQEPSEYIAKDGPAFTMGAPLVPHCLVKIDSSLTVRSSDGLRITTQSSTKPPWKSTKPQMGLIPDSWLKKVAKSTSLHPFYSSEPDEYIIPLSSGGFDSATSSNKYWKLAEDLYSPKKGKGKSTGKTLLEHINFNNALLKQVLTSTTGNRIVAYNAAGRYVRAARYNNTLIFEYSLFWRLCSSSGEAKYLTSILNADCLQDAYYSSQNSDRHFQDHFWEKVPIPAYNKKDKLHMKLADLCASAETIAAKCLQQLDPSLTGQIKRSNEIRDVLDHEGTMKKIDAAVRKLLPKYST